MDKKEAFAYAFEMTCAKVSGGIVKTDENIDKTLVSEFRRFSNMNISDLVKLEPLPPEVEKHL